ncbi:uncharacterized protein at2g33490 [Phtheirospermum japonicum]|uniref:Uncharacterized protein at2g33490 n=1 Tax=Phtheirospermum japonicum TaxID=374723 RepID=A0A830CQ39_9LAMI|nr:uncharacterized protein at2g33490 [Phtheirospermum japonicum]
MKSPLEKLRNIGLHKSGPKGKWDQKFSVHTDGLTQAAKDMKDMRTCYDSLLSAAAATANSAYEFSEALLEMGNCLLEKTAMHDNGESKGALSMLGKLQLELQKLVDSYRSHIIMTITNPSESLLSELRKVEEMKLQCDEKREMFDYMAGQFREKGRSKQGKGETFTSQQLQVVCEEYDDVARLCIFRVESLKQGQSRSLLTQAAQKQHIDCELNGEKSNDDENSIESNDYGELSFDYRQKERDLDIAYTTRNSMELDQPGAPSAQTSKTQDAEGEINSNNNNQSDHMISQRRQAGSYSAPIYAEKFDIADRIREMRTANIPKHNTHVLPTPADAKATALSDARAFPNPQMASEENVNNNRQFLPLPRPLTDGPTVDNHNGFDTQKIKRQSFSDSLASKPSSNRPLLHSSGPHFVNFPRNTSPPPPSSSPKINELHELPRPPDSFNFKPKQSIGTLGHSAPLGNRNRELSPTNRNPLRQSREGSPLPLPQLAVSRSFSIPSSSQRSAALHSDKQKIEEVMSPPLTPLLLSNMKSPIYGPIRVNAGGS